VATMIGCLPTQALAVFVYATTHSTQAIAFELKRALVEFAYQSLLL